MLRKFTDLFKRESEILNLDKDTVYCEEELTEAINRENYLLDEY